MLLYDWLDDVASAHGSAKAVVYRDTYLAWRGLVHRVDRRSQELAAIGIGKGAWVGLMLGNVPDFLVLALALSKLGAVIVPIDPTTASLELELVLETTPLRALITRPRGSDVTSAPAKNEPLRRRGQMAPVVPAPKTSNRKVDATESRRRLQGTLLTCSLYKRDTPDVGVKPELVLLTSDSSGDPKGAVRTRENLLAVVDIAGRALDVKPEERVLVAVPGFHAYGMDLGFLLALKHGLTLYLEDEMSATRVAKMMREQQIDLLPGTPTLYSALAKMPTARPLKAPGARYLSAGAALPASVCEAFRTKYGVKLLSAYHTTETGLIALDRRGQNPESVGKPVDGVEVRLGSGARSSEGPIWVRSRQVATRSVVAFEDVRRVRDGEIPVGGLDAKGFHRTGDIGRMDRSGRLSLTGREDDLVKVDGKRVALGEVEGCLESFPKVKQAQARVVTDPLGGPMVVARVVAAGACEAEEIIDHCARNLAPYKVPRRIEFCESLG